MKYKLRLFLIGILSITILLTGCGRDEKSVSDNDTNNNFVLISKENGGDVIYDKRTGVEYWRSCGAYNSGTLTLLVDENGNPLIYDRK